MKKQLLFDLSKSFVKMKSFRTAAFATLAFFAAQSSFAQTWVGGTSSDFLDASNWSAAPTFTTADVFTIAATGNNGNQITNTAAINCRQITLGTGVTFIVNADLTTNKSATTSANGTFNINAGTATLPKFYTGNGSGVSGVVNVESGATLAGNDVWRVGAVANCSGTININGGTLTLGTAGGLSLGHLSPGTININSGTVNVNYTAFSSLAISANGTINIDGGSMVIPGDQTAAVKAFIDANKIKVSGAALAAGKTISNSYEAATNKTTVIASAALGVNYVVVDANSIAIYPQNDGIAIQSENSLISNVEIYDISGRLVVNKKSIGSGEANIALNKSNAVYVIKVTTADNKVITKKLIQ